MHARTTEATQVEAEALGRRRAELPDQPGLQAFVVEGPLEWVMQTDLEAVGTHGRERFGSDGCDPVLLETAAEVSQPVVHENCFTITHLSPVRVVFPCSACAKALAPSSLMLLLIKLWQCQSQITQHKHAHTHTTYCSCLRVVLPCSAWASALAPSSLMLFLLKLCRCQRRILIASKNTLTHFKFVRMLPCSTRASALAPLSPMLLPPKLCQCQR
jgi:hypothetical protein